jgi:hypothetical protein
LKSIDFSQDAALFVHAIKKEENDVVPQLPLQQIQALMQLFQLEHKPTAPLKPKGVSPTSRVLHTPSH